MKLCVYLDFLRDCFPRRFRAHPLPRSPSARRPFDAPSHHTPPSRAPRAPAAFMTADDDPSDMPDMPAPPPPPAPTPRCRCFQFIPPDSFSMPHSIQPYFPWKPPSHHSFFSTSLLHTQHCMGFEFSDGTTLPYVPLSHVVLQLRYAPSSKQSPHICLSVSPHVYTHLVQSAQRAFRKSTAKLLVLPPVKRTADRLLVDVHLNPCASDVALDEHCICTQLVAHYSTLNSAHLPGRALVLFCIQLDPNSRSAPLLVRLHRFQLHHALPL
ncbi:unnamed protein product [Agarophyton chilense]|eukprot:gb/GEZJ01003296.1/.p2 GENE.gb/GEZJ01003296.1/~~gb/GEZJ01003296.1/.p2  ORF type:complete len:280 (+),score=43.75 gb/GEZJ01003296.1/:38-841(+)